MNVKKLFIFAFVLLITSFSVIPALAAGNCVLQVSTAEAGNKLLIYQNNEVKYSGVSDQTGMITIKNMEEGKYKAVFQKGNYQAFDFELPYDGSKLLTAYPKPIEEETTTEETTTKQQPTPQGPIIKPDNPTPGKPDTPYNPNGNNNNNKPHQGVNNNNTPSDNKTENYEIKIVWDNGDPNSRPGSVNVDIYEDNKFVKTITISKNDNWTKGFSSKSKNITVTLSKEISGYSAYVSKDGNTFIIKLSTREKIPYTGSVINFIPFILFGISNIVLIYSYKKKKQPV